MRLPPMMRSGSAGKITLGCVHIAPPLSRMWRQGHVTQRQSLQRRRRVHSFGAPAAFEEQRQVRLGRHIDHGPSAAFLHLLYPEIPEIRGALFALQRLAKDRVRLG